MNVVLLGALSAVLPVDPSVWLGVLARRVPERTLDVNRAAFAAGRACLEGAQHA